MAIHEIERACGRCEGKGATVRRYMHRGIQPHDWTPCSDCAGRGRVGVRVDVGAACALARRLAPGFYWRVGADYSKRPNGPYATQDEALAAAREAL